MCKESEGKTMELEDTNGIQGAGAGSKHLSNVIWRTKVISEGDPMYFHLRHPAWWPPSIKRGRGKNPTPVQKYLIRLDLRDDRPAYYARIRSKPVPCELRSCLFCYRLSQRYKTLKNYDVRRRLAEILLARHKQNTIIIFSGANIIVTIIIIIIVIIIAVIRE